MSDRAIGDLADIYDYIAIDNPGAAERLVHAITGKITTLAAAGNRGAPRNNISPGLRVFPYRKRCIYFRVVNDDFIVLRVLHARQDVTEEHFKD